MFLFLLFKRLKLWNTITKNKLYFRQCLILTKVILYFLLLSALSSSADKWHSISTKSWPEHFWHMLYMYMSNTKYFIKSLVCEHNINNANKLCTTVSTNVYNTDLTDVFQLCSTPLQPHFVMLWIKLNLVLISVWTPWMDWGEGARSLYRTIQMNIQALRRL